MSGTVPGRSRALRRPENPRQRSQPVLPALPQRVGRLDFGGSATQNLCMVKPEQGALANRVANVSRTRDSGRVPFPGEAARASLKQTGRLTGWVNPRPAAYRFGRLGRFGRVGRF